MLFGSLPYTKEDYMDFEKTGVKPEDLSYRVAKNAHQGTSQDP